MDVAALLREAVGRLGPLWHGVVEGLPDDALAWQPAPGANPIGWLAWHASRIVDDHVAHLAGVPQVWPAHAGAFDLGLDLADHGYGHDAATVAAVGRQVAAAGGPALLAYVDAALDLAAAYADAADPAELDRIVDESWDPPVTAGVRVVSLLGDALQHAGQAAYVRGLHGAR